MGKFDLFNKFNSAVIVINNNKEAVFRNNVFKRIFPDYKNLEKFSHKLNYNVCALVSNDVSVHSPIVQALASNEDFSAYITYQTSGNELFYYDMNSTRKGQYNIIVFTDVTAKTKLETLLIKNQNFQKKISLLEDDNRNLSKVKLQAQSQAMKLLLLNNISNIIRESIDTSVILKSALEELAQMFGAFRGYYAEADCSKFIIRESLDKKETGLEISFDNDVNNFIKQGRVSCLTCMKEFKEAKPFREIVQRVVLPIYHLNKLLGIIVLSTKQKTKLDDTLEVLNGVSSQLGNAIIQAELYKKNEKMVKDLTKTLEELKDTQLKLINSEKMASLGQLVAGVAHEINTPVASIKSNNEITKKIIAQIKDADICELLQEINEIDTEAIARINRLVVSLRKFVRLDEAELQEADINKEIDLTLDLIRHETKNRIEIIKNYSKLPPIKCYPNMLNQVFMNILVNATHAIKEKGTITIDTNYKNNNLLVKIKDTGCGIKEPDKIFFAGYTTKGVGVGTGLGLAISQKIIEKHNGKITVKTKLNEGSEFTITIPSK
ncbi:gAF sensor signal transduction histidine kinase [Acinetobacter sp. CAG:196]|jgi:signal transduction histidine kinase|nr:gAF sensor signal transduction histidine kinase [Acinetobacter sp. CAG:196]